MIDTAIFQMTMDEIIHLFFSARKVCQFFEIFKEFNY